MNASKKFLNISIGISMVLLTLGILVYSLKDSKAIGGPQSDSEGYLIAGVGRLSDGTEYVIGYNPRTKDMKKLAEKNIR